MASPTLDDDAGLFEREEEFSVQKLVAEFRVEALAIAVLPLVAWHDVSHLRPHSDDPVSKRLGDKLGTIVGSDVTRYAAKDEQIRRHVDDVCRLQSSVDPECDSFARELVDNVQHSIFPAVMGAILDES